MGDEATDQETGQTPEQPEMCWAMKRARLFRTEIERVKDGIIRLEKDLEGTDPKEGEDRVAQREGLDLTLKHLEAARVSLGAVMKATVEQSDEEGGGGDDDDEDDEDDDE